MQSLIETITALHVVLGVRVEIFIACGASQTQNRIVGWASLRVPLIGINALVVVADREA